MRPIPRAGAAACALAVAIGVGSAAAKPVPVDLRVEGGSSRALTADRYLTDTTSVRTETGRGCRGSGDSKRLEGATALGALVDASRVNARLTPLGVSDQFDLGLLLCGVGDDFASGDSSFWLYKVNHVAPEVGGDAFTVKPGDEVLWYFSDTAANQNTGDELELVAPARARRGEAFEVTVYAYDSDGKRRPAAGVRVTGAEAPATTDASGAARLTVDTNGYHRLRAGLAPHVPAAPLEVCVYERVSDCASARGTKLYGSRRAERIRGSAGPDVVLAAGGRDRILVRGGGTDRVRCGRGRDVVRAGRLDRVAADCELVRRRGRS